ncbi:MAG TPA: FxsA family protein, partial [Spirochaetia bacterium]
AVVPVGEIVLFVYLGAVIGNYLILVIAAVAGLPGALMMLDRARRTAAALRARIAERRPTRAELLDLAALVAAGLLLVTPGFVTDACGYLLFIPGVRRGVARFIGRALSHRTRDVAEYLGLL